MGWMCGGIEKDINRSKVEWALPYVRRRVELAAAGASAGWLAVAPPVHPPRPAAVTCARRSSRASRGGARRERARLGLSTRAGEIGVARKRVRGLPILSGLPAGKKEGAGGAPEY